MRELVDGCPPPSKKKPALGSFFLIFSSVLGERPMFDIVSCSVSIRFGTVVRTVQTTNGRPYTIHKHRSVVGHFFIGQEIDVIKRDVERWDNKYASIEPANFS